MNDNMYQTESLYDQKPMETPKSTITTTNVLDEIEKNGIEIFGLYVNGVLAETTYFRQDDAFDASTILFEMGVSCEIKTIEVI